MDLQALLRQIQNVRRVLQSPLTPEEGANGWTAKSKEVANNYFANLEDALVSGNALPSLDIARGLDHWGVGGGNLLESIAEIANALGAAYGIR